jgi:hypothetical protein
VALLQGARPRSEGVHRGLGVGRFYLKRLGFQALRSTFLITYFQSAAVLDGIGVEDGEQALARWQQKRGLVSDGPDTDPSARPVRRLREARSGK